MNILLAAMAMDIGGAETHIVGLANELKRIGYKPVVVSSGGIYVEELKKQGIKHYNAPLNKKDIKSILKSIRILKSVIDKEKIQIIHAHGRIPALNGKILSSVKGIPFMTTAHAKFTVSLLYKYTSFWGKEVISISEDIKNHLIKEFSVKPERITIIPNGIDTDKFNPNLKDMNLKSELNLNEDTLKIVYVSRISGPLAELVKLVIEAVKEAYKELNNIEIIIAGDGDRFEEVCRVAEKVNKEFDKNLIHMLGKRTDIPEILSIGDLAISVSRSALEAMACEKPVILAGGEGYMGLLTEDNMEAAISNNFTGRTSNDNITVEKLKNEILTVLKFGSKERAIELGQLGREIVTEKFSVKKMTEKTVEIYKRLLKRSVEK
ncbi:glycosyltransferase family 4 protein [Maledivibacter halophilus]|uniref:Glycosyltransferase involved in cell wall bisynthesis n=1 Tax=Maledivibacter halophilus TaxID=36842 RepID=A0A1T5JHL1_9FIRM|nr:glycosyltransferase family 4 protein [Maledivibacter halophilus]SKC50663.1 Glycosyltransferase involved in cell wall bisynthesis [Maledivibacter halophilus]